MLGIIFLVIFIISFIGWLWVSKGNKKAILYGFFILLISNLSCFLVTNIFGEFELNKCSSGLINDLRAASESVDSKENTQAILNKLALTEHNTTCSELRDKLNEYSKP